MEMPTHVWVPSIGVSGMLFYGGAAFPEWRGDIVVGGMSGQRLVRLHVDGVVIDREEVLLQNVGRIRDVAESPKGHLYLAIDGGTRWEDGPPTKILRVEPAGSR
jgi:glucose/arabinose dehydrogenase